MILIDSSVAILKSIADLHKENAITVKNIEDIVRTIQTKSFWDSALFGVIIGTVLGILGQILMYYLNKSKELDMFETNRTKDISMFETNRKKDIDFKVAELYGIYKNLSTDFGFKVHNYDYGKVIFERNKYIVNHYQALLQSRYEGDLFLPPEDEEEYDKIIESRNKENFSIEKTIIDNEKKYTESKLKILEILHQIHFYSKDKLLSDLIMEFHKTNLHNFIKPADIKPKNDIDEVRSLNFIKNYVKENIQPITQKRKELFDKISARILEL